jgi:hypothetical protein
MFTVGISEVVGLGSCGFGPIPALAGSFAESPQAARSRNGKIVTLDRMKCLLLPS